MLYACDGAWWEKSPEARGFTGLQITADERATRRYPALRRVRVQMGHNGLILDRPGTVGWGGNSGFQALNLAVQFGARQIVLIGYDMQISNGLHWHGRHGRGLNNPGEQNVRSWRRHFETAAPLLASLGVLVINASRETALECFPRKSLDTALAEFQNA